MTSTLNRRGVVYDLQNRKDQGQRDNKLLIYVVYEWNNMKINIEGVSENNRFLNFYYKNKTYQICRLQTYDV